MFSVKLIEPIVRLVTIGSRPEYYLLKMDFNLSNINKSFSKSDLEVSPYVSCLVLLMLPLGVLMTSVPGSFVIIYMLN